MSLVANPDPVLHSFIPLTFVRRDDTLHVYTRYEQLPRPVPRCNIHGSPQISNANIGSTTDTEEEKKRNAFYTMSLHTCVLVKCPKAQAEVKQYGSEVRGACLVWSWVYFSDGGKKCLDRVRARRREELNKQEDDG